MRATHSTASTNSRLSVSDFPGSPFLPGNSGAIRAHCSSFKILRTKAFLPQFSALNQISRFLSSVECRRALVLQVQV